MIIIGITGSIGMGKTTISAMFRFLNIPVFDSDKEVKEILEKNKKVKEKIADIWPETIISFQKEIKINKVLLSNKIFKTKHERKTLEKIIHPLVKIKRKGFIEKYKECYFVGLDVPLLYETGSDKECHYIFLANTSTKKQKERVLKRENMTEEKFNLINNSQWCFERKKKKNPFLISTSFGKLFSFFIVLVYLLKIMISHKVINNERTCPRH